MLVLVFYFSSPPSRQPNPLGILTNEPQFPQQLALLQQYLQANKVSSTSSLNEGDSLTRLTLQAVSDSGVLPVPGGFSPTGEGKREVCCILWCACERSS